MYRYFVSYFHQYGFGRCYVTMAAPIRSMDDIEEVERLIIGNNGLSSVGVLSYQLFSDATE